MPRPPLTYPKTPTNTVHRYAARAKYDTETVHSIVNTVPVLHVSFLPPGSPVPTILPMIGRMGLFSSPSSDIDEALDLYLHGYVSARLFRANLPVCVAATIVDGIVLSLTPYNHSMNYRSAVLHGEATLVDDPAEKLYAMELITEGIFRGRWSETRTPTATELTSTGILRVRVTSASAKVSRGPPGDGKADLEDEELVERGWTGVVPMWTVLGVPVTVGAGKGALPAEMGVEVEERNERSRREAVEAVKE